MDHDKNDTRYDLGVITILLTAVVNRNTCIY